jgi:putative transposase
MKKIPPSEQIRQEISSLLPDGTKVDTNLFTEFATKNIKRANQEALEQEMPDHLRRGYYERRRKEAFHRGYRNGYDAVEVKAVDGPEELQVPQLRDRLEPYRSKLLSVLSRLTPALGHRVREIYVRGLSTREIEDVFQNEAGRRLLSRTAVSELTEDLWEEYGLLCQRRLDRFDVEYLFLDAVYESMRLEPGEKRHPCGLEDHWPGGLGVASSDVEQ